MKRVIYSLLVPLVALVLFDCKQEGLETPPVDTNTCKLMAVDPGNGTKRSFDYNAAGLVSKMSVEQRIRDANGNNAEHTFVYAFTYNSSNQLTDATIKLDGHPISEKESLSLGVGDATKLSWTNGRLTQVIDQLGSKPLFTTTLSYDGQGRVTKINVVPAEEFGPAFAKTYTYDAQGNFKFAIVDGDQESTYINYTVDKTAKQAQSLLAAHGLPFDLHTSDVWQTRVITRGQGYSVDDFGKAIPDWTYSATNIVKNAQNIATSYTLEDNGQKRTATFTLADCN